MSIINNAAPAVIMLGADDNSTRALLPEADLIPQHTPKVFVFGQKGPNKPVFLSPGKFTALYGSSTFDKNSKYYNHATRFLAMLGGAANNCVVHRVVSADAGARANIGVYLDIVAADLPNYVRNADGSIAIDGDTNTEKVNATTPTISGYKIKCVTEHLDVDQDLGLLTSKAGTMTGSTMYPILELKAKYQGEYYNNIGFKLASIFNSDVNTDIVNTAKTLPYNLSLVSRADAKSSPVVVRSLYGETSVNVTLKNNTINPSTGARFDIKEVFNNQWFNETDALKSLVYKEYEGMYVYENNLESQLSAILANEKDYVTNDVTTWEDGEESSTIGWYDFTTDDAVEILEEKHLINPFTCKTSKNIKLQTVAYSDDAPTLTGNQKEINLSTNTPVFLGGGSDGSLDNEVFEALVTIEMAKYADENSEVQDTALNVESVFYDSGFTPATKLELVNFIALRKDTVLMLSTHDAALGEKTLSLSQARAVGVTLRTRMKLAPESSYFGTSVARGGIVVGAGKLRDGSTSDYVATTYDIGYKAASMMGAANGVWDRALLFDNGPSSVVSTLIDIEPAFIPGGIKPTIWADGLIWAQPYDRVSYHFPAIQTVYDNDTSALNSIFTAFAIASLSKIGADAWRQYTGNVSLTEAEFTNAVSDYVMGRVSGKFAGMYTIVPEVSITDADKERGYSWQLVTKIYGNNMKTVMVHSSSVYRATDLVIG